MIVGSSTAKEKTGRAEVKEDSLVDKIVKCNGVYNIDNEMLNLTGREHIRLNHDLLSYPGKLHPNLARLIVSSMKKPEELIADPFCGSGTTLLEAIVNGSRFVAGCDINPMARFLTEVKTDFINPDTLNHYLKTVEHNLSEQSAIRHPNLEKLELWYDGKMLKKLICLQISISKLPIGKFRKFLLLCFLSTAKKLSLCDPRISVPVKVNSSKDYGSWSKDIQNVLVRGVKSNPLELFKLIVEKNVLRMNLVNPDLKRASVGIFSSHDALPQVDWVITSPPYFCSQKYFRSTSIELLWLDMIPNGSSITKMERNSIGSEHALKAEEQRSETFNSNLLPIELRKTHKIAENINPFRAFLFLKFSLQLKSSMEIISQKISNGGLAVFIAGGGTICGEEIPLIDQYKWSLESAGLKLCGIGENTIKSRALLTKRKNSVRCINKEYIFVARKK